MPIIPPPPIDKTFRISAKQLFWLILVLITTISGGYAIYIDYKNLKDKVIKNEKAILELRNIPENGM